MNMNEITYVAAPEDIEYVVSVLEDGVVVYTEVDEINIEM